MNIFILDENIEKCAQYHCDKHIIKMILESAQLLCTAHWINKYAGYIPRKITSEEWEKVRVQKTNDPRDFPYLPTMYNHPCSIWVRESLDNYEWLYKLADELNKEYGYRYGGKSHKSMHDDVIAQLPDLDIPRIDLHGLHSLCQTRAKQIMQSKHIESSTTKTKEHSQLGKLEENPNGGM